LCQTAASSDCRFGDSNVLLNGPGARANGADYASLEYDGYASAKDDEFGATTFMNAEQRLARLRQTRQVMGCPFENSRRYGLIDRKLDAADKRAVLSYEGQQVATGIDHRHAVSDTQARGLCLGGRQYSLCIFECEAVV
jgi:hypothetical protein